jgi:poly-gamma-glutamate capsule biosynthesis protein CapA/YwtB (metallophosphatase superfamily)
VKLFVSGDVMAGRGIDQILAAPSEPGLGEPWVKSALDYVALAERESGPIPRRVAPGYIWGDALAELERARPEARIINLETAVTRSEARTPKGINYRMNPANIACLRAAGIDCCVLANNHVLDWGRQGLEDTLDALREARIVTAGAGRNEHEAAAPAMMPMKADQRLLVYAFGTEDSGVPADWAADATRPGVNRLGEISVRSADETAARILWDKRKGDCAVVSIHWGSNWGYEVPREHRAFARRLVDAGAADLVHGHSSHHPRALEIHRGRLILYGCGDLLNDYEGIGGHREFRPELGLMYFPALDEATGELRSLELTPMRMRRFRLERAGAQDTAWLAALLQRESGLRFEVLAHGLKLAQ